MLVLTGPILCTQKSSASALMKKPEIQKHNNHLPQHKTIC